MSITTESSPNAVHAAYNAVEWLFSSDRSAQTEYTGVTVADSGGWVQCTQASHAYAVGDVITLSGFTEVPAGRYAVTAVATNTFTLQLAWDSGYAGDSGTTTRSNDNMKLKLELKEGSTVLLTRYLPLITVSGNDRFSTDLSGVLGDLLGHDVADYGESNAVSPSTQEACLNYTLTLTELWDNADQDGTTEGDDLDVTTIGGDSIYAHNTAIQEGFGLDAFADYICSTGNQGKALTTKTEWSWAVGEEIQLTFLTSESSVVVHYTFTEGGELADDNDTLAAVTVNNGRVILPINSNTYNDAYEHGEFYLETAGGTRISDSVYVNKRSMCLPDEQRLEWVNRLGGLDSYTFRKREDVVKSEVMHYLSGDNQRTSATKEETEMELVATYLDTSEMQSLRELLTSAVVYLFSTSETERKRVNVVENKATIRARDAILFNVKLLGIKQPINRVQ